MEKPEAIIVTMPVKFLVDLAESDWKKSFYKDYAEGYFTLKQKIAHGYHIYLYQMNQTMKDENSYWLHKISAVPTVDVIYCYITVLGYIRYRANIGGFEPGGKRTFDDGRDCEAKHWMILTHPFIKAPEKIPYKGFQGFRYSQILF